MPGNRSRSGQRGPAPEPERRRRSPGPQGTQSCSPRRPPPPPQADGHPRAAGDGPPGSPRDWNEEEAPRGGHAWRGSRRGNGLGAAGVSLQRAGRVQRRRVTRQAADRLEHLAAQANPTPGEDIPGGWSLRQLRGQAEPPSSGHSGLWGLWQVSRHRAQESRLRGPLNTSPLSPAPSGALAGKPGSVGLLRTWLDLPHFAHLLNGNSGTLRVLVPV